MVCALLLLVWFGFDGVPHVDIVGHFKRIFITRSLADGNLVSTLYVRDIILYKLPGMVPGTTVLGTHSV
jgi:hypothetical protein